MYFEIYRENAAGLLSLTAGQWRWRLVASNEKTIASGESYVNKGDCEHAVNLVKGTTYHTPVRFV